MVLQAGRSRAEQTGDVARLPLYHWAIAELRLAGGQWDDALAEAQAGLGLIEEHASHVGDVFANAICAHVAFHRGDPTLAQSAVRRGPSQPRGRPARDRLRVDELDRRAAARDAGPTGRGPGDARPDVGSDRSGPLPPGHVPSDGTRPGADGARPPATSSEPLSVTEELERSARRSPTPTARGLALRCRGLLANDPDVLLEAVAAHRGGPRPYQLAAACEDAGIALGHSRQSRRSGRRC